MYESGVLGSAVRSMIVCSFFFGVKCERSIETFRIFVEKNWMDERAVCDLWKSVYDIRTLCHSTMIHARKSCKDLSIFYLIFQFKLYHRAPCAISRIMENERDVCEQKKKKQPHNRDDVINVRQKIIIIIGCPWSEHLPTALTCVLADVVNKVFLSGERFGAEAASMWRLTRVLAYVVQ